jgi:ankyrin repeat protein
VCVCDASAVVNAVDGQNKRTPWELTDEVKDTGKKAAVEEVLSKYSLHAAASAGKAEHVRALIAAGLNVNAKGGERERTPAHLAAASGHNKALQLLLDAGADLNAKDWVIF